MLVRRRKFTLMPLIALGILSLGLAIPVYSASAIHAAPVQRYTTVVVRPGDNVWSLAAAHAPKDADVNGVVDEIVAENHIGPAGLVPGQRLRIPL